MESYIPKVRMIASSHIQAIKEKVDIIQIIQPFLRSPLKRQGSNFFALSPFSDEKSPSFSIHPHKNIFKCFSSGKGGDVFTFLQESQGMTFVEAVRYVAEQIGYEIPEGTPEQTQLAQQRTSILAILQAAAQAFYARAPRETWYTDWLQAQARKLDDPQLLEAFQIGHAVTDRSALVKQLLKAQYTRDMLLQAGLAYERDDQLRDRFRRRILFPIRDHLGRVVGFGARKTDDDTTQQAKYINSPESQVYQKSKVLYGLYESKERIRQQGKAYMVEGYTDVLAGWKNNVAMIASCGTAVTEAQVALLARFTNTVVLWLDRDGAGVKATARAIPLFLAQGFTVKISQTSAEDPDAYFRESKDDLAELDWMDWVYQHHQTEDESPAAQAKVIRAVQEYIEVLPFDLDQQLYQARLEELSGIQAPPKQPAVKEAFTPPERARKLGVLRGIAGTDRTAPTH